jgi:hypothetical protein
MKNLHTFEEFLNESKIEKMAKAWYYEEIKVPGLNANNTTVKSEKDSTKAASALVNYWEKGKSFETVGFTIKPEDLQTLESIAKAKVDEVVTIKLVDGKSNKDFSIEMEVRDKSLGIPSEKHLYVKIGRV